MRGATVRLAYPFAFWCVTGIAGADTLDLPEETIRSGRILYLKHCAQCHGRDAAGDSGPDIQGIVHADVVESAVGVEAMPAVELAPGEAREIAVFLVTPAPDQARRRLGLA